MKKSERIKETISENLNLRDDIVLKMIDQLIQQVKIEIRKEVVLEYNKKVQEHKIRKLIKEFVKYKKQDQPLINAISQVIWANLTKKKKS